MNSAMFYSLVFVLFFVIIFSIFFALGDKERKKERTLNLIAMKTPEDEDIENDSDDVKRSKLYKLYDKYYNTKFIQANLRITYGEFKNYFIASIIVVSASLVMLSFIFSPFFSIMCSAFLVFLFVKLPDFIIENKKHKRKLAINAQKSDILSIMSSCSSSQMPLDKTYKVLSERLESPVNEIFYEAYSLIKIGNSDKEVLRHLRKVFDSDDFDFLLSAYESWLENQGSMQDTYKIVSMHIRNKEALDLKMQGLSGKAKTALIMLVGISLFFVILSIFSIGDIFIPFAKSLLGQVAIVASFFLIAFGAYKVNSIKNNVKY